MEDLRNDIAILREETAELIAEKDGALIEHFNEEYGAGFGEDRTFDDFSDLYSEDGEGYFDPFDLFMDEKDVFQFMNWCYRKFLIINMKSITESIERIESGEKHTAIKALEKDVSDLRKYKKYIQQIIAASNTTLDKVDELIKIADKYRK